MVRIIVQSVPVGELQSVYIEANCISTDTKPTANIANGSIMTEVDTGKVFMFNEDAGAWVEEFGFQS